MQLKLEGLSPPIPRKVHHDVQTWKDLQYILDVAYGVAEIPPENRRVDGFLGINVNSFIIVLCFFYS